MSDVPLSSPVNALLDDGYEDFIAAVRAQFSAAIVRSTQLFRTDATDLWNDYLAAAPDAQRKARTCSTCRKFVERYGSLVTIDEGGNLTPAMWREDAPPAYRAAAETLAKKVANANVTGPFRSAAAELGKATTGEWTHLAVDLPASHRWASLVTTAHQEMASKAQERKMLLRGLDEFPLEAVRKAELMLRTGRLFRSEKCEGIAKWLLELHERRAAERNERLRANLTWLAVGRAPPGFCHVKGGMIGTLLEDVVADVPFAELKRRFDAKMHPLQYQRAQVAPSAENIAQAEKLVATLRTAGALERRFARLADVQAVWRSKQRPAPKNEGVFGHLRPAGDDGPFTLGAKALVMTWVKFAAEVLPTADSIELAIAFGKQPYAAIVTAKNADAPPILQWDHEERRNPASLYLYVNGSNPETWNLTAGQNRAVTAVILQPSMLDPERARRHQGASVVFLLAGARDTSHVAGGGLFCENLRSEYHPIRRTLEAHFNQATIEGRDEAEACGLCLSKGGVWNAVLRVTSGGIRAEYTLDRWD